MIITLSMMLGGATTYPYYILLPTVRGGILLNGTNILSGKLINFNPDGKRAGSLFCQEGEVDLLFERIYTSDPHHNAIAYHKTHLAPAPRDPLTDRIKDKKVVI